MRVWPARLFGDEGKPVETMATHGTINTFNPQVDDWPTYIERLQHYFVANDVEDADKKRAILLTVCGVPTYKLLRSLVPDGKLDGDDATYNSLVKLLKDHYNPTPSPTVQRFHFNSRTRGPNESVAAYVAALRELALHCEFGDRLQEMLCDRLVCGVNHKGIQRKLLAEAGLTYERAYSLALAVETSERDAKALQSENPADPPLLVHHVSPPAPSSPPPGTSKHSLYSSTGADKNSKPLITCYHCGGPHLAPQCSHLNTVAVFVRRRAIWHVSAGGEARLPKERGLPRTRTQRPTTSQNLPLNKGKSMLCSR